MFNKALSALMEEANERYEFAIFRRKFNASASDNSTGNIDMYFRSILNEQRVTFFSMTRTDYNRIIHSAYNQNAHSYARAFHVYHHLQDTGQLEKWRKLAREHRLLA